MIVRKKVKKRTFARKYKILLLLAGCAASCLFALFLLKRTGGYTDGVMPAADPGGKVIRQAEKASEPQGEVRAVFPYSVIPGGVQSREELVERVAGDRVVSDHYRDFKVSKARIVKADKTRMMHVSYRMDDQVYWTKKKVRIPEGEMLITDGECEARARCGNRVSASPREPVSDEEPMMETFDLPRVVKGFSPDDFRPTAAAVPTENFSPITKSIYPRLKSPPAPDPLWDPLIPPSSPGYAISDPSSSPGYPISGPPSFPGYPISGPSISPGSPIPVPPSSPTSPISLPRKGISPGYDRSILPTGPADVVVPEPGTLILMMTGIAAFFAFRFFRRK